MRRVALLAFDSDSRWQERIGLLSPSLRFEVKVTKSYEWITDNRDRIEVLAGRLPEQLLKELPSLRWIHNWGSGVDYLFRQLGARRQSIIITNCAGIHQIPISEHVLWYMLSFSRASKQAAASQLARIWASQSSYVFELAGKSLLIVGYGTVGRHLASLCRALGMHVIGIKRSLTTAKTLQSVPILTLESLPTYLPQVDFAVSILPLTPDTVDFWDRHSFQTMKPGSYFINVGRGESVVENDLVTALESHHLAGAALDVVRHEPLTEDSPLWGAPNLILTAHYAGSTPYYDDRAFEIFCDNMSKYPSVNKMRNVIAPNSSY